MDPFLAEIRIFPLSFAPKGWALCDGQLLPISQNTALFSLLGTTYGGNGTTNFALPNFQGNVPIHAGQGPGLSLYDLGQEGGSETVSLLQSEIPAHAHAPSAHAQDDALIFNPGPNVTPSSANGGFPYNTNTAQNQVQFDLKALAPSGGDQPHNNLMPYLTLSFCIALQGVVPARS